MEPLSILVALAAILLLFRTIKALLFPMAQGPFPPGPPPKPLIGNLLDMPTQQPEKVCSELIQKYGDIVYLNILGTHMMLLGNARQAADIFEKHGSKSSGRPEFPMAGQLMGWDQTLVFNQYGEHWRNGRKLLHQYIGGRGQLQMSISKFGELEERHTRASLARFLGDHENLDAPIRKTAGAIILEMAYGYRVNEEEDPYVSLIESATETFAAAAIPGKYLVDTFPIHEFKYVPSWMPGAGWKRDAKEWRALLEDSIQRPYDMTLKEHAEGKSGENFVTLNLDFASDPWKTYVLKTAAASLYGGGADTTVSTVHSFFLAMTLYPDVQRKAQAELDSVVGDRLPSFQDRDSLPYVGALVSEVLRWLPVAPFTMRLAMEDFTYGGYPIPKGTVLYAVIWHMLRDPATYKNPEEFRPERFLKSENHEPEQDPRAASFGFGRRICPGMNIAEASVWISCATYLHVFNISKVVKDGVEVTPVRKHTSTAISHPHPFPCSIKPRSEKAAALIHGHRVST